MSGAPVTYDYIRSEGLAGRIGARLMAIVAEGDRGRIYLAPTPRTEVIALAAEPSWKPEAPLHGKCRVNVSNYGLDVYGDLFTTRQLVALTTFSDLVHAAREKVSRDAQDAGVSDVGQGLADGGNAAAAYAEAVAVYLAIVVDRLADYNSTLCTWHIGGPTTGTKSRSTFSRQALGMTWDFTEVNPLSTQSGSFGNSLDYTTKGISIAGREKGFATQGDAATQELSKDKLISTDPPYYDNIGYADLSDFFYVWLRPALKPTFPDLFSTLVVPKTEELVATPYRHGSKQVAEQFFLKGMTRAMRRLSEQAHPAFPVTIYYAFKQAESGLVNGMTNTGWDTFLGAVIEASFEISGTWPMRTELGNRMIGSGTNALASSIILVCRPRPATAPTATRREFVTELKAELPMALANLQRENIAPVDLAQASIGPGMAVYTRYSKVLDAEGNPISVRAALALINESLDEALAEQEGDFDADSRWALAWFEQSGFAEGDFGVADVLARAKVPAVAGFVQAGIVRAGRGKVCLLKPSELPADWNPAIDPRLTAWEVVHQLVRALESGGERAAAAL